ncbi:Riboflavin transporter RibZ [Rubrobacter xylanophilus DSM 9941]|uniref:MFS transporter n=1 Tax=Rubrobacter xylanophilus TaxID=49319 RepID=UPI001F2B8035|nr:MFS transporter [Rubrobacter xylanophilus]QYJ14298.1 Riboflavin transporter RibZ [Rubrobacter xylanophilus DSM 9941]
MSPSGSTKGHRLLLAVLTSAVFVSVLNSSMVNVVVPVIARDFHASEAQIGWVITGFLLSYAVAIPLYGRISDAFSLRKVFAVGLWVFAAGSFVCALAPDLPVLVLGRILQAAGGAAVPALGTVAVTRVLPPGERGEALGLIISSVGVGAAVGPIVGGTVEELASWHLLFYGSLLLSLLLIPGALRVLPDGAELKATRNFDLPGGILLGLSAGLFLFGITQGQTASFTAPSSWGSFLSSAFAATLFVRRINTASHPFVSPKLFANPPYVAAVAVGFFSMFANVSTLVTVPLLVTSVNGLSPGQAGLVLTPGAAALAALSPFTGRLSDRIGVKLPIRAGLSLMLASTLFLSTLGAGGSPILVAAGMLGVGTGFAFANPPTNNAAANALTPKQVGAGLGIFNGAFFLGGGTGPAIIGTLLAARNDSPALNPLYTLDAAPFSDAFLAISVALLLALCASMALRNEPYASPQVE